jgi:hypothetical protein
MKMVAHSLRALWWAFVILTPLLAVWLSSSLAVFLNGPVWLAVLSGSLLFPGLPLIWEGVSHRRFLKKQAARKQANAKPAQRWLLFWDRLTLRTLTINLLALGVTLGSFPKQSFTALSTRGDWVLELLPEQTNAEYVGHARVALFAAADGVEWLHNLARENPYEDDSVTLPVPTPSPQVEVVRNVPTDPTPNRPDVPTPEQPSRSVWPMADTLHPLVTKMPASAQTSIESVALYIAASEKDPFQRVKAMHDWIAENIAYDFATLTHSQTAEDVFTRRTAVCAGYARLLVEMGKITGDEVVYLVGVSRDLSGEVGGIGHAWNAVKIQEEWYLVDVTWNAGHLQNNVFVKAYGTDYLFTPPDVFHVDHFPDEPEWQLLENPISRGDWMRRPMLKPGFYAHGLKLEEPVRSQSSVGSTAQVILGNPSNRTVVASLIPKGDDGKKHPCDVKGSETARVRVECDVPADGIWQVQLFAGEPGLNLYPFVGQIEVVARR